MLEQRIVPWCAAGADNGAVLRRRRSRVVARPAGAGARHVLRHDGRMAGDVLADMARDRRRIEVVAAADREADQEGDSLAL